MRVSIIAALGAKTRAIGKNNRLLWQLPVDLARFKRFTMDNAVLMGTKTWQSLPPKLRPLPGRHCIVMSRDLNYDAPGAYAVCTDIEQGLEIASRVPGNRRTFIGGGGEIYRLALPYADDLVLTLVDDDSEGDTHFPEYEDKFQMHGDQLTHPRTRNAPSYTFCTFKRAA